MLFVSNSNNAEDRMYVLLDIKYLKINVLKSTSKRKLYIQYNYMHILNTMNWIFNIILIIRIQKLIKSINLQYSGSHSTSER